MTGKQDSHLLLIYENSCPITLGCMWHLCDDEQKESLWQLCLRIKVLWRK